MSKFKNDSKADDYLTCERVLIKLLKKVDNKSKAIVLLLVIALLTPVLIQQSILQTQVPVLTPVRVLITTHG